MLRHLKAPHMRLLTLPVSAHLPFPLPLRRLAALLLPGEAACNLQETLERVQPGQHNLPPVAGMSDGAKT